MSPESLFHRESEWRQLFSTEIYQSRVAAIAVDEAHYGRLISDGLAELRSILPNANMLALTATASPSTRTSIMKKICMEKANVVVGNCDRKTSFVTVLKLLMMKILIPLG